MERLAQLLSLERDLLESQLDLLATVRELLDDDSPELLGAVTASLEESTAALRVAELHRALEVSALAERLRLPPGTATLRAILTALDGPWGTVIASQGEALRRLHAGLLAVTELACLLPRQRRPRATGCTSWRPGRSRSARQGALAAVRQAARLPSLEEFLQ